MPIENSFKISINKSTLILSTLFVWISLFLLSLAINQDLLYGLQLFQIHEHYSFLRYLLEFNIYLLGNIAIFFLPGALWLSGICKKDLEISSLLPYAFVTSILLLIIGTSILKIGVLSELQSNHFMDLLLLITITGLLIISVSRSTLTKPVRVFKDDIYLGSLLIALMFVFGWFFQNKLIFVGIETNFSSKFILSIPLGMQSDILENYGLVNSLRTYLLPFWDLEYADRFGYAIIDPPLHMFTSLFLILFSGQSYAAQSLNSILFMIMSFWLIKHLSSPVEENRGNFDIIVITSILFSSYLTIFLTHNESSCGLLNLVHYFCFFTLAQFYFLLRGKNGLFLMFSLLAFLSKYEAMLFTLTGLYFYYRIFKVDVKSIIKLLKNYLYIITPYILLMISIGLWRGDFMVYIESFSIERFMRVDYLDFLPRIFLEETTANWSSFSVPSTLDFLKNFALGSTLLGFVIFLPQKNKTSKLFSKISLVYFMLVMISQEKRIHYFAPLALMSLVVAIRTYVQIRARLMRNL